MTSAEMRASRLENIVELTIPVQPDLIVMARLAAATVATRLGFDIGEVEDLRLAVDELCLLVVPEGVDGRLRLGFGGDDGLIEITCRLDPNATIEGGDGDANREAVESHRNEELSGLILGALVDEYDVGVGDGHAIEGWLMKRKSSSQV